MASYAAAIREELGVDPVIELGTRGQFDVFVQGELAISRKGGLFALITRKPWPSSSDVIHAIQQVNERLA